MYTLGLSAAIFGGGDSIITIMMNAGLGLAGLIVIIFSTVTTTFMDAYSAGVSSTTIYNGASSKGIAVIVTLVGTIAAILYPMDDITDFLYLIGSVFAPMIDHLIGGLLYQSPTSPNIIRLSRTRSYLGLIRWFIPLYAT